MASNATVAIQICYASANEETLLDLVVPAGTTVQEALAQSAVLQSRADVDLSMCRVGIFGKSKPLDTILRERDRIEIYRPLIADPKDARQRRVIDERRVLATERSAPKVKAGNRNQ